MQVTAQSITVKQNRDNANLYDVKLKQNITFKEVVLT